MRSIRRFLSPTGYSREHPPDSDISSWAFRSRLLNLFFLFFFFLHGALLSWGAGEGARMQEEGSAPRCLLFLCLEALKWC